MMKKRHVLHLAMGVVMTPLLGSCAADEIVGGAGSGNGVLSFGVEVNAGAPEVKPMGGATRSAEKNDSSAVMSPDVEGFFPTSSIELSSVDGKTLYANCDERRGINMHNNVDYKITRGSIQTTENFYDSFALYGYVYDSGKNWKDDGSSTDVDSKIIGVTMSKNGNGSDYNASGVYWPGGSKKATFFAVAPNNCSGASITANPGGPTITYTVPQTVSNQEDLLVAVAKDVKCDGKNAPNPLAFNHALAAIKFEAGELGDFTKISNVEISGVKNTGTLSSFTPPDTKNNLEWTIDENVTDTYSSDLSYVMFLMPQTIPDGAKLKVKFKNDTEEKDFEADLGGTTWEAGHQYTYKLSVNKVTGTFYLSVGDNYASQTWASATLSVSSYFQYNDADNTQIPIKWSVSSCGATINSISGSDTDIERYVELSFSANNATSTQNATLQAKSEEGTKDNPVDLSIRTKNSTQVRETANCYVINAPGWYMFPLVYGNGIKSNSTNYDNNLTGFKDNGTVFTTHESTKKMSSLTSPWINDSYEVSSCELLWQDAEKLIEYDSYKIFDVGGKKYMKFHISSSDIKQGNAVLAVKNSSDQILWSWHIWVTALDVYNTQEVTTSFDGTEHKFNFMPVPLGWYFASEPVNPKTYTLSVVQEGSGKTSNGTVTQAGARGYGNCTFYQWGRKDPFPPSDGSSTTSIIDKTLYAYDTSGTSITVNWSPNKSLATIATSILYPSTFYNDGVNADWCKQTSYELWNVGNSVIDVNFNQVTKSVYDPSPAGFRLPETAAFTGFKAKGLDGMWDSLTRGYTFTTNSVATYWQACGCRSQSDGSLNSVGSIGRYWSAGPYTDSNGYAKGYALYFVKNYVDPQYTNYRKLGCSVRPVSE